MDFPTYRQHDALALADAVRAGRSNATELLILALSRLKAVQPKLNPVARRLEKEASAQIQAGLQGPLAGVPFLLKDAGHDVAGVPTTLGSQAFNQVAAEDSHYTRRCKAAGLVIFGKTNSPELALKGVTDPARYGRTSNPWDPARTPGGSSGGAAAAVASGVVPMAGGGDGGGSIRIPAACCGLVGLRPSRGRISEGPQAGEVWLGCNSQGVITRSIRDSAAMLDVLSGPEPGDPFQIAPPSLPFLDQLQQPLRRLRIGWSTASPLGTPVHGEAVEAVQRTVQLLQRLGHETTEAAPDIDGGALARSYLQLYFALIPAAVDTAVARGARRRDFEPLTRIMATLGRCQSAAALVSTLEQWNGFSRALGRFHSRFDLYLTPTLASPPVPHGTGDPPPLQMALLNGLRATGLLGVLARLGLLDSAIDQIARDNLRHVPFTQLANVTGTPAISLPLHWTAEGLPLGVQFHGAPGSEGLLLQLGAELEKALPWFDRLPRD
ncbi:amidase [Inhella sp. 4Y17]|uniref:Amidase n=2 Tax=Inhella gelatinilytica TaxID=2795030 RepID=A0A931IV23_9BURK|nr:amidase [Inhella gelatinilytica]